jgi:hypothetical protein
VRRKPESEMLLQNGMISPVFQISLDGLLKSTGGAVENFGGELEPMDFPRILDVDPPWSVSTRQGLLGDDELSAFDGDGWSVDK